MHPRTLQNIDKFGLKDAFENIPNMIVTPPLDYFKFQKLIRHAKMVITDSGGIQEETTFLQKPCLTLRPNTERPSTITVGTNTLLDFDSPSILEQVTAINLGRYKRGAIPHYWDGQATHRILQILKHLKL